MMEPLIYHEWKRLDDLPPDWRNLCREDLAAIRKQWKDDRELIRDGTKIRKIRERLALQWAIETGIIERLYKVNRGITVQILEAGMEALGNFHAQGRISKEARALITDQRGAIEMVMDLVGGKRVLSNFYIKELHHRLTLSQKICEAEDPDGNRTSVQLLKGQWKKQPNNPTRPDGSIHRYCPPEFVQDEIDHLLKLHKTHDDVCPEVEAAWLHHRFTQIHPFQDGNGRVARALTSAIFLKADCLVLVVRDEEHRERYLNALEAADRGDLKPLVDLFADIQISDLNEAIHSVRELRGQSIVCLAKTLAERTSRRKVTSQEKANQVIEHLIDIANTRLEEVAGELRHAFRNTGNQGVPSLDARVLTNTPDTRDWWAWQIVKAAKTQQYYADLTRPRRWVLLSLKRPELEDRLTRFVISLHAVGRAADLHAAVAFLTWPLESEGESGSRDWHCDIVAEPCFRVRVETVAMEVAERHFREWLERVIESGLSVWGENV
ncbi:MAG: hypothetical protein TH68_05510 [Candidatus Synechococcus spongiarum 142]|uniref:Fido domain-containing protein n=1 Tax=Candidatus Synechococcus spongiarum 142 TaxID=1608213 RepID=A0A6N3X8D6_9SYNE|nr:MAG: hypothetical protein TH68_05510 [Candidatus Synechococcus spongiarum 142]